MFISSDEKKAFEKTKHFFMIKTFNELDVERMDLDIIKVIHDKPTANILEGKGLKISLSSGQGCPLSSLFNTAL